MNQVAVKRWRQVAEFGWKDAQAISQELGGARSRLAIFFDILSCFREYHLFSNQYRKFRFWELSAAQRKEKGTELGNKNRQGDEWLADNYRKWCFAKKWGDKKFEATPSGQQKRKRAYTKEFHAGEGLTVQYNVVLNREHYLDGTITIGKNVVLAKNAFVDYSGHVTIGDNVTLSDGIVIESHEHPGFTNPAIDIHTAVQKDVIIEEGAIVGARAIINASVGTIGRYARIGAGAVLRQSVPPYAIVTGNPAKVVGFSMTPEQMEEFEKTRFPEEKRLSVDKYAKDYDKMFLSRIDEIKKFLKKIC